MADVVSYLKEWTITYLKNKDAFFKRIEKIEESSECSAMVHYKNGRQQCFLILPEVDTFEMLSKHKEGDHIGIVLLNNEKNRKSVISQWNMLKKYSHLILYFVNPFSKGERKWVVMPYTHAKICEDTKLGQGLNAMAELVGDISESVLKERIL